MKHWKKKKGASLIIVLMVLAVAMIFSSVTLTTISKTTKANAQEKKSEDVLFSAESGLEYGIAWFNKNKTTGVISVPPTNGCTYDVKVEPDGSNYKIISKATINGKSKTVSVKVNKIETPPTAGGGLTIGSPFGVIVPTLSNMKLPTASDKINDIRNALTYEDEDNIYNLYKTYWPTDQIKNKIGRYETVEINYNKVTNPSVAVNIGDINTQFESSTNKQFKQKNVSNDNITIYTVENGTGYKMNNGVMYVDGDLKITSENNQSIDQDLNKMGIQKILVKGTTNIIASGDVKLNNFNIETNKFVNNSQRLLTINNSSIKGINEINTFSKSGIITNNLILISKNVIMNDENYINFSNTNITTLNLILKSKTTMTFQNISFKSPIIDINNENDFSLSNSTISTESININTKSTVSIKTSKIQGKYLSAKNAHDINIQDYSEIISEGIDFVCNSVNIIGDSSNATKGYTKIVSNNFNADCGGHTFILKKALIIADISTIKSNQLTANYSGFLVKNLNLNTVDVTVLNQSSMISEQVDFFNTRVININNNGLDKTGFDSIVTEMNKYLPNSSTPGSTKYELDKSSIKYE